MASLDAARQATWLAQLLKDLGFPLNGPFQILNNNKAAILLSKNPVAHECTKHINIQHHFLWEKVLNNSIDLTHVLTKDDLSDALTKPLDRHLLSNLCNCMGLQPNPTCQ